MIAIKDFKMPSCCYDCDFSIGVMSTEVDRECTITEKYVNDDDKPDWCPLVEVPVMNIGNSCSEIPNSSDCISRQAAIDEIKKCRFVVDAIEKIRGLPSVHPEIIRCRDCAWSMTGDFSKKFFCSFTGGLT